VDFQAAVELGCTRALAAGGQGEFRPERLLKRLFFFAADWELEPGEAERRFGEYFKIERTGAPVDYTHFPPGEAVYWMTRKNGR
jgi:hypothetical protein